MEKKLFIAKKTAAETKGELMPKGTGIYVDGDLSSDVIPISLVGINDSDAILAYNEAGSAIQLTATKTSIALDSPAHVLLTKPTTTNAVGVYLVLP